MIENIMDTGIKGFFWISYILIKGMLYTFNLKLTSLKIEISFSFSFSDTTTCYADQDDDIIFEDFARLRLKGETEA